MNKTTYLFVLFMATLLWACNSEEKVTHALIETSLGNIKVELYNQTPLHRDNFIKLANEGFYDGLLFHRVMRGFMIQGGDPDSKGSPQGQQLGQGGPGYKIDAEIGSPHVKGALAAARQGDAVNPQKQSSGSQFYIVHGNPQSDAQLDQIQASKGITYNEKQRELYKTMGGAPFLDMEYTVFGMVTEGFEVIDKIATVPTNQADRPTSDVTMKISIVD